MFVLMLNFDFNFKNVFKKKKKKNFFFSLLFLITNKLNLNFEDCYFISRSNCIFRSL